MAMLRALCLLAALTAASALDKQAWPTFQLRKAKPDSKVSPSAPAGPMANLGFSVQGLQKVETMDLGAIASRTFSPQQPPTKVINLDLPPEERWTEIIKEYRPVLIAILQSYFGVMASRGVSQEVLKEWLEHHNFNEEHLQELDGIVMAANSSEVTRDKLILWQLIYEMHFPTFCSAFLAATPNGTVIHARNLDYALPYTIEGKQHPFHEAVYDLTWMRGGKPLMTTAQVVGQIGLHTAMRIGGWSWQQNSRLGLNNMRANLESAKNGGKQFSTEARRIMEQVPDFKTAVKTLAEVPLMAPQYFIVAGPGPWEGATIAREREPKTEPHYEVVELNPSIGRWYFAQTNDDIWDKPDDNRRPMLDRALETFDQTQINEKMMTNVMLSWPYFNPSTEYTWVGSPISGTHHTYLRTETGEHRPLPRDPMDKLKTGMKFLASMMKH